ncbi:immunity 49 family protein [Limibacter armeniacum]|uniref:immunity 49 family protein n=1 Tax=Limibacter armeniacum TaxID=466084 RepID=UPI002FE53D8A
MRRLERHRLNKNIPNLLEERYNFASIEKIHNYFNNLFESKGDGFRWGNISERFHQKVNWGNEAGKSPEEIYRYLTYARDLGLYVFKQFTTPKGKPFQIPIAGKVAEGEGAQIRGEKIGEYDWIRYWEFCVITRYSQGLDLLDTITEKTFKDRGLIGGTELGFKMVDFFKSLFSKDVKKIEKAFREAYEYTDIDKYPSKFDAYNEYTLYHRAPLLEVYLGIITKDEAFYNEKLYEGLSLFRQFVEMPPEDGDPPRSISDEYFITWPYLAAVHMAKLNGLKTEVSSDYLPQWLVEGNFDQLPITLPEKA